MSKKKNTKEHKIEELTEALTEVVGEDTAKETTEVEIHLEDETSVEEPATEEVVAEEPVAEEPATEETVAEEPATEEVAAEVPAAEEIAAEEATAEEVVAEQKANKGWKIAGIVLAAVVVVLAGVYVGVSVFYKDCFLMGTKVNGIDCSGMSVEEVNKILEKQVEEYELTIEKKDGTTEVIKGADIGISYNEREQVANAFKKQNVYIWPKALFVSREVSAELDFQYDSAKLDEQIAALKCLIPENQTPEATATVVYQDGAFVIKEEIYGTRIDTEKFADVIVAAVSAMQKTVNVDEEECYIQPKFKKDSPEVAVARDEMNKYLGASITYTLGDLTLVLDKNQTNQWFSVDENMNPVISTEAVQEFTNTLSSTFSTPNRGGNITTPNGKVASVKLATYGRTVGKDAEAEQIVSEIKEGAAVNRSPILSSKGTPEGETVWGTTYLEVDISQQHIWYVVNGAVALETDVITGNRSSHDTPSGFFKIVEMVPGKFLRGKIMPNGEPEYITWVDYWMRITWSGVGFHDAGWRSVFGGSEYYRAGSHGCINMPPEKAKELYGMISVGTPVVIHY